MKTLKDILKTEESHKTCTHYSYDKAIEIQLKDAAIEWVKMLRPETASFVPETMNKSDCGASVMLIHFFNLTEEDLK